MQEVWRDLLVTLSLALPGLLVCTVVWLSLRNFRRLLPPQRLRAIPWTGGDVAFAFIVTQLLPSLVMVILRRTGFFWLVYGRELPLLDHRTAVWGMVLSLPLQIVLVLGELRWRGMRLYQLGLTCRHFFRNALAGFLAWLLLTPTVLLLFGLITQWFKPEEHTVLRIAREQPELVDWVLVVLSAVVAAPFMEELLFRGILLPWLRKASALGHFMVGWAALAVAVLLRENDADAWNPGPVLFVAALLPGYWLAPQLLRRLRIAPPRKAIALLSTKHSPEISALAPAEPVFEMAPAEAAPPQSMAAKAPSVDGQPRIALVQQPPDSFANATRAIYGTSLLFAAFHSSVWPSPIPLFLLALGLSWLAYRTQSLIGPLVVHSLFNLVPCVVLLLPNQEPPPTKGSTVTTASPRPAVVSTSSTVPASWLPRRTYPSPIAESRVGENVADVMDPTSWPCWSSFAPGFATSPESLTPSSIRLAWPRSRAMTIGSCPR